LSINGWCLSDICVKPKIFFIVCALYCWFMHGFNVTIFFSIKFFCFLKVVVFCCFS